MRVVAKFQLVSAEGVEIDTVSDVLQAWGDSKFNYGTDGTTTIKKSGVAAIFEKREEVTDQGKLAAFDVLESVPGGQLQTQVKLLKTEGQLHFQCTLALGSEGGLALPEISIRSPRFIREIIALPTNWRVAGDAERVFAKCFEVKTADIDELEQLIKTSQRRLPVIVVSELHGRTLAGDIHERISVDTCGLAHTCRLTNDASWELTNRVGKDWSCYNGAIRLFWPFRGNRTDPRAHPLWTMDRLMWRVDDEREAKERFMRELNAQLIEASTFVADDPAFARHDATRVAVAHAAALEASRVSVTTGDYKALADSYAAENDILRNANASQLREIEVLKLNVEALSLALQSKHVTTNTEEAPDTPPQTIYEALEKARSKLGGVVLFGDDIDESIRTLKESAGPPDKVFRYLMTLGELARTLDADGQLGRSAPLWLRERQVDATVESETIRNNRDAKRQRTFKIGGDNVYCDLHAKPSDGVHPDLCVRIYFTLSEQAPRVRVGYIGRHF